MQIFNPPTTFLVSSIQPMGSNQHKQDFARGNGLLDSSNKVDAWADRVDVHEDLIYAEAFS